MDLAKYIDHTLLKPEATQKQIRQLCREAKNYGFACVCVNPCWVKFCAVQGVRVCTVIGFPLGTSVVKTEAAKKAIKDGAEEIDMVINIGKLKDKQYDYVRNEIKEITSLGGLTKVIIETCLLNNQEKIKACQLAKEAGADFIKTSTGFAQTGATVEDVKLLKKYLPVKAAGGIKTRAAALKMLKAGAMRLGASAGVQIVAREDN